MGKREPLFSIGRRRRAVNLIEDNVIRRGYCRRRPELILSAVPHSRYRVFSQRLRFGRLFPPFPQRPFSESPPCQDRISEPLHRLLESKDYCSYKEY